MRSRPPAALCIALLATVAPAAGAVPSPEDAVMASLERATAVVIGEGTRDAKLEALKGLSREILATREMGRAAIGPRLGGETPAAQEEFLRLFDEVVVRAYVQKLLFFRRPRFEWVATKRGGETATVQTKIVTRKYAYTVDYGLRLESGAWVARDVTVEGVSLVDNYNEQFRSLLRTRSFDELLDLMRRKVSGWREDAP